MYFNSRPSARGDDATGKALGLPDISIHAPPRGATRRILRRALRLQFQFTPLREGRHGTSLAIRQAFSFQFTPLREGRRTAALHAAIAALFQFTPLREGRRVLRRVERHAVVISIHAPPRGATRGGANRGADVQGFQFTPLREGRRTY